MSGLRFGDSLLLYGQSSRKGRNVNGLMTAQGYGQDGVYLEFFKGLEILSEEEKEISSIKTYRDSIFQIWPKLDFEAHKEFKKLNKNKQRIEKKKNKAGYDEEDEEEVEQEQEEQYYMDIVDKLKKIRQRVENESSTNYNQIEQARGQLVTYGQEIFLMHADSGQFVNGTVQSAQSDQGAYRIELSKVFNKGMIFKIFPRYKLRQEGEAIQYKDNIRLFNVKLNCFVNYDTTQPISLDKPVPQVEPTYYREIDIQRYEGRSRYECFSSNITEATWQFQFFRSLPDRAVYDILGGSLVMLKHTESSGYLTADFNYVSKDQQECYIRNYHGDEEEEQLSVFSIWEIEVPENKNRGEELLLSSNQLDPKTGKIFHQPNNFILRHFVTGKVITLSDLQIAGKKYSVPTLASKNPAGGIQFISTSGEEKHYMENNICYILAYNNQQISIQDSIKYQIEEKQKEKKEKFKDKQSKTFGSTFTKFSQVPDDKIYVPLKDSEYEVHRYGVVCDSSGSKEENAFQIIRLESSEYQELFMVSSQVQILQRLSTMIKAKQNDIKSNKVIIRQALTALAKLIFFVSKSTLEENVDNAFLADGVPVVSHQRIVRDFRLIEIIMDILYYPFKYEIIKLEELGKVDIEVRKIFELSYKCLMLSIKEYRPNELYASQWLDLMLRQAKLTTDDGDIGAEEALTELIDNNRRILETKISEQTIKSFIDMLLDEKTQKYVKMVEALCVCDGTPMIFNQAKVSEMILEDAFLRQQLIQNLEVEDDKLFVQFNDEKISLFDFKIDSNEDEDDQGKSYNYFIAMLGLCSGLCLGRNYIAMEQLEQIYPLSLCEKIISSYQYEDDLRREMIRLVICLYIDRAPFSKLIIPDRVRIWHEIEKKNESTIPITHHDFSQLQALKKYAQEYLKDQADKGYSKTFDVEQNQLTLQVLAMVRMMVTFGFFLSPDEISTLCTPLIRLLEGVYDVSNEEEEGFIRFQLGDKKQNRRKSMIMHYSQKKAQRLTSRYEDNDKNIVLHEIKQTICWILIFILKLRDSSRVSYILLKIQQEYNSIVTETNSPKRKKKKLTLTQKPNEFGSNIDVLEYATKPFKWIQYLMDNRKIDLIGRSEQDITLTLLDLTLYQHDTLVNMSLNLIYSLYSQKQQIVNSVKEVQLLEEPLQIEIYKILMGVEVELGELVEKSEQWMWKDENSKQEQAYKIIKILELISDNLVVVNQNKQELNEEPDGETIPQSGKPQKNKKNDKKAHQLMHLFAENEECNTFAQELIRNLKIYEQIINLIKFDAEQFTYKRIQSPDEFRDENHISHRVLKLSYQILGRFCYLDFKNQKLLMPYLHSIFLKHVKHLPTLDVQVMLEPFLQDNKLILNDSDEMNDFLKVIVTEIDKFPFESVMKPAYFECVQLLSKNKGKVLKGNQTMIINELTHRDYSKVVVTYYDDIARFKKEVSIMEGEIASKDQGVIAINAELDYFNAFLHLMSIICEDKNNATESKTQNYFPLSHLSKLIEAAGNSYYFIKELMFFFYHVYLDTEREMTDELLDIKKGMIERIQKDIKDVSGSINESQQVLLTYKGLRSIKQIKEEYFYNALTLCVETIIRKRMIDDFNYREEFHETFIEGLFLMSQSLEAYEKKYVQVVKNALAMLISVNILELNYVKDKFHGTYIPSLGLIRQMKLNAIHVHSYLRETKANNFNLKQEKVRKRMETIQSRQEYKDMQQEEMILLIDKISNIEAVSKKMYKGACTIPFNEIIQSMIDFTKKTQKDVQLTILRLKIFRQIIQNQNNYTNKEISEWETDDMTQAKQAVEKAQTNMVELGIVNMIYSLMMDENQHPEIVEQAILLSISLLLGGNKETQNAFYKEMTLDNTNSFLVRVKEKLQKGFENTKKTMNSFNKKLFEKLCSSNDAIKDTMVLLDEEDQELAQKEDNVDNDQIEEDDKTSMDLIIKIFRLLQLLCEGHNEVLQNHLRQQTIDGQVLGRNHDFIFMSAILFASLTKFLNVHSLKLGNQLIDFIIESIQGPCHGNQVKLVSAKIIDSCKDLLSKFQFRGDFEQFGFTKEEDISEVKQLVTKSTTLLISLIEGKSDKYIETTMCKSLDFDQLFDRLKDSYSELLNRLRLNRLVEYEQIIEKVETVFDQAIMEAFQTFMLVKHLSEHSKALERKLVDMESEEEPDDELMQAAIVFFSKTTKSIEIQFKDDLIRVYFPVQPICRFLSKNTRERIMAEVPRDSPNEKTEGLVDEAEGIFDEMDHMAYLNSLPFNFSQRRLNVLRDISTLVSILINLNILISYHEELDENGQLYNEKEEFSDLPTTEVIKILGYIQLVTSSLMLVFWIFIHSPLILTIKWRNFNQEQARIHSEELYLLEKYVDDEEVSPFDLPVQTTIKLLYYKGPHIPLFNRNILFKNFGNIYTFSMYLWKNFIFVFGDARVKYFFFYITISFIGSFISEIAYSFHLLDIIGRFPTLQNVIKSVTANSKQLLLTSLLGIILMYIWAILGFYFIDDNFQLEVYDSEGQQRNENQCTTLLQCFVVVVNQGLILGGGIGDFMAGQSYHDTSRYYVRYIYDLLFFMVVKMAFLNIIFGIIIDTFAALRDDRSNRLEDMKNICFICGQERGVFDQFSDGFENHIERDHHLWNYIYYLYNLKIKDHTEYNGIESYVSEKYQQHDQIWFPLLKSLSIENQDGEDEEEQIQKEIENINKKLMDMKQAVTRVAKLNN